MTAQLNELAELRAAIKLLEAERHGNHAEIDRLRAECERLKDEARDNHYYCRQAQEKLSAEVERLKAEAQRAVCVYCGESFDKGADGTILEHIVTCEKRADKYELLLRRAEATIAAQQDQYRALQGDYEALEATLAEREAEIERLRADRDHAQATTLGIAFDKGTLIDRLATARKEALEEAADIIEPQPDSNPWSHQETRKALIEAANHLRALASDTKGET